MENKKRVLIVVGIIVCVIVIAGVLFVLNRKENESGSKISQLVNDDTFFSVQFAIKQYYNILVNNDGEALINILEEDYKKSKNISKDTVDKSFSEEYDYPSYMAVNVYHDKIDNITYYFVNGFLIDTEDDGHLKHNIDNVNFLVIVDESSLNYVIRPLEGVKDLKKYANDYNLKAISIKNGVEFTKLEMDIKEKLESYLHMFIDVLIYKPEKAYDMIYDSLKNRYESYEKFNDDVENIYPFLENQVESYTFKDEDNGRTYYIKDTESNNIKIFELSPNNFKVSFEKDQ